MSDDFTLRLHAYADGELSGDDACAVEAHLETCAACRASLQQIRDLKAAVKRIDWGQAAPQGLADGIRKRVAVGRARQTAAWAGAGLMAACLAGAFLLFRPVSPVDDVVNAHMRALGGGASETIAAAGGEVKPWLRARLAFAPPVLDQAAGCTLVSASTDRVARQRASALTYDCAGHRVDFYAVSGNGRDEHSPLVTPRLLRSDRYRVVGWQRGKLTCFAVSDAPAADILRLARFIEDHAQEG